MTKQSCAVMKRKSYDEMSATTKKKKLEMRVGAGKEWGGARKKEQGMGVGWGCTRARNGSHW